MWDRGSMRGGVKLKQKQAYLASFERIDVGQRGPTKVIIGCERRWGVSFWLLMLV